MSISDNFIEAFTGKPPTFVRKVLDFPASHPEMRTVYSNSTTDSREPPAPSDTDGNHAIDRYQVIDILPDCTELRFFSSQVQHRLHVFDHMKRLTTELNFLLENVSSDDRENITSVLESLTVDRDNALLECEGMEKEQLIPWINEFFISYPQIVDLGTFTWSMCKSIFECQKLLQFNCDPLHLEFESNSPHHIKAADISIAAAEVVASLDYWGKKYFLLNASQIKLLKKHFKFDGAITNFDVIVIEKDIGHDITDFIGCLHLSKIIIEKDTTAPIVRCKVEHLTDECKERLLSTEIGLQGRTVELRYFATELSDALLHFILQEGSREIPKCADIDPSENYVDIERILKSDDTNVVGVDATKLSKVLIISDLPGAGKTTTVTKLSLQLDDWVIKVNLNAKSPEDWKIKIKNTTADYLSELASIDPLLKLLLRSAINDSKSAVKISVICDALDEVMVDHVLDAINFILRLTSEKGISNVIVTTRPHLKRKLEKYLDDKSYRSYSLVPFKYNQQIEFITKSINTTHFPSEKVEKLFREFFLSIDKYVLGTPMMLQLIAGNMPHLNKHFDRNSSVHSLYRDHVNRIFRNYLVEKSGVQNNVKGLMANVISANRNFYYYFAVKQLLHLEDSDIKAYVLKPPSKEEIDDLLRHGLIVGPGFLFKQKSFAEYFLAKWLMTSASSPHFAKIFVGVIYNALQRDDEYEDYGYRPTEMDMIFLEGEAHESIIKEETSFYDHIANEIISLNKIEDSHSISCTYGKTPERVHILDTQYPKLTRYICKGILKYCGQTKLQEVLLTPNERTLLHRTRNIDEFNLVMELYKDAGLTDESLKSKTSRMSEILKQKYIFRVFKKFRNRQKTMEVSGNILFYENYDADVQLAIFGLLENYLDNDDIIKLMTGKLVRCH